MAFFTVDYFLQSFSEAVNYTINLILREVLIDRSRMKMGSNISLRTPDILLLHFKDLKWNLIFLKKYYKNYLKKYFDLDIWFKRIRFKIPDREKISTQVIYIFKKSKFYRSPGLVPEKGLIQRFAESRYDIQVQVKIFIKRCLEELCKTGKKKFYSGSISFASERGNT